MARGAPAASPASGGDRVAAGGRGLAGFQAVAAQTMAEASAAAPPVAARGVQKRCAAARNRRRMPETRDGLGARDSRASHRSAGTASPAVAAWK